MPPQLCRTLCRTRQSHNANFLHRSGRSFTTSTSNQAEIPPESPRFIEIPRSVQPSASYHPWVKGVLPVPRKVATQKPNHHRKETAQYLAATTPEPLTNRIEQAKQRGQEVAGWKARQAEFRRRNLREGLVELQVREERRTRGRATQTAQRQAENRARRDAPIPEDERLTTPTVLSNTLPVRHRVLPDPDRSARLQRRRQNVLDTTAVEEERRRRLLHDLYVNAGDFVLTDAQLEESLSEAFDSNEQFKSEISAGLNIWNLGQPESTKQLLDKSTRLIKKGVDTVDVNDRLTRERVRKITEELTGGRI